MMVTFIMHYPSCSGIGKEKMALNLQEEDIKTMVAYCREHLDLQAAGHDEHFGYPHLPLCVVDAVFSIGVRYESTARVVTRTCTYFGVDWQSPEPRFTLQQLLTAYDTLGVEQMTDEVFINRQRTSSRSGILKSEAVWRFAQVLNDYDIDTTQAVGRVMAYDAFEAAVRAIPGQRSGISLKYFYMLSGAEGMIKPDRMILRFIAAATGRQLGVKEAHQLIVEVSKRLQQENPVLNPRLLDRLIWNFQRERGELT